MRIVALADTHEYESCLNTIPEGDVVIHAGDWTRYGRLAPLQTAAQWFMSLPHPHKILIAGNHDWCFVESPQEARALFDVPGVFYLQDSGVTINDVFFYGSPWQPEFHNWAFNLPRGEALRQKWEKIPTHTDVLITHGPPRNFGDVVHSGTHEGCDDLFDAVERIRPALHVFGHIHECGGAWPHDKTWIANVTCDMGYRQASVFDWCSQTREVSPVRIPPCCG